MKANLSRRDLLKLLSAAGLGTAFSSRLVADELDRDLDVLFEANLTAQVTKEYLAVFRIDDALDAAPETRMGYHMPGRVYSIVLQGMWQ